MDPKLHIDYAEHKNKLPSAINATEENGTLHLKIRVENAVALLLVGNSTIATQQTTWNCRVGIRPWLETPTSV